MARYIDADKLWNDRPLIPEGKSQDYGAGFSECMFGFSERIRKQIDNPMADVVEVKHGEWKEVIEPYLGTPVLVGYCCSECEAYVEQSVFEDKYFYKSYCPNCGAKMDAETTLMNNQDL